MKRYKTRENEKKKDEEKKSKLLEINKERIKEPYYQFHSHQ